MVAKNKEMFDRADDPKDIGTLFEEAMYSLKHKYMYMCSYRDNGRVYDCFKHTDTREYVAIASSFEEKEYRLSR